MGARGPAKGSGGRPRSTTHKANPRDNYERESIGPPSKGRQVYVHRAVAGVVNAGKNVTVDHKDVNPTNNKKSNLQVVSRAKNVSLENKRNAKKTKKPR